MYKRLKEKVEMLEVLGADVRPVPAVPFDNPENYNHQVCTENSTKQIFKCTHILQKRQ